MKKLILTSAAIIAFGGTAIQAQDNMSQDDDSGAMAQDDAMSQDDAMPMNQSPTMTPQQQTIYNGLTASQKASFDSWDLQQKGLYFALSPEQRTQLWALPAAQQAQAWMAIRKAAGLPEKSAMSSDAMSSGNAMSSGSNVVFGCDVQQQRLHRRDGERGANRRHVERDDRAAGVRDEQGLSHLQQDRHGQLQEPGRQVSEYDRSQA